MAKPIKSIIQYKGFKVKYRSALLITRFTVCYELMDYILALKADKEIRITDFTEIDKLYKVLQTDWKEFNKKPLWLLDALK